MAFYCLTNTAAIRNIVTIPICVYLSRAPAANSRNSSWHLKKEIFEAKNKTLRSWRYLNNYRLQLVTLLPILTLVSGQFRDYDYQDFQPRQPAASRRQQVGRGEAVPPPRDDGFNERQTTPKTVAILEQINE